MKYVYSVLYLDVLYALGMLEMKVAATPTFYTEPVPMYENRILTTSNPFPLK
jgi:hypothetical protein